MARTGATAPSAKMAGRASAATSIGSRERASHPAAVTVLTTAAFEKAADAPSNPAAQPPQPRAAIARHDRQVTSRSPDQPGKCETRGKAERLRKGPRQLRGSPEGPRR